MNFAELRSRLRVPVIAAPMFLVSGPALVIAACRAGVVGAFPTANCRSLEELASWLDAIDGGLNPSDAPYAVNLIVHRSNSRLDSDLELTCRHRPAIVVTSVGSPAPVVDAIHDYGGMVFADVASMRHAEKALAEGADGLILLTAGAGGQTGWANPFAFVRGVRSIFNGPVVLAGGVADAVSVAAAEVLGCDLAYMGTRFIATQESQADPRYKQMIADSGLDDIKLTRAMTGLETNMLTASLLAAGLDPDDLPERGSLSIDKDINPNVPRRWKDVWSAGHSAEQVMDVPTVAHFVGQLVEDYRAIATKR
ncbi:MAG: nitronate monooxygenase [Pseudomonadota bacterium]